jgi:hypothetical protein
MHDCWLFQDDKPQSGQAGTKQVFEFLICCLSGNSIFGFCYLNELSVLINFLPQNA